MTALGASLFPELAPVVEAVLFAGLQGAPRVPRDPAQWSDALPVLVEQRLSALALHAAKRSDVTLPEHVGATLFSVHRVSSATTLKAESTCAFVVPALRKANIKALVIKGPGIASAYPDPALRPFVDIDLLVSPGDFTTTQRALTTLGFTINDSTPEPRRYFHRLCREGVSYRRPDGAAIDLHHHIPPWLWGEGMTASRLNSIDLPSSLGGDSIPALTVVDNFLVAALHVISDKNTAGRSLLVWRDVAQLATHCDATEVARRAGDLDVAGIVGLVLQALPSYARSARIVELLKARPLTARERVRLRFLLPPGLGSRMLAPAFRLPMPQALAYAAGYAFPSRSFIQSAIGPTKRPYLDWWRAGLRRLRSER